MEVYLVSDSIGIPCSKLSCADLAVHIVAVVVVVVVVVVAVVHVPLVPYETDTTHVNVYCIFQS